MIKRIPEGARASLAYTLSMLFSKGLAIITVPIFTRLMPTDEVGVVGLYNSWYAMLSAVATLALTSGGAQLALKEFSGERDRYLSSVLTLTSLSGGVLCVIYLIAPEFWNQITGLSTSLMLLLLVQMIISPALDFWLIRQRYEYKYKSVALVSAVSALFAAVASVIAVLIGANRGEESLGAVRLFANNAVMIIVALGIGIVLFWKGKTFFNAKYWKFSMTLSLPLIGNSIASQILSVSDREMIDAMVGKSEVGIYSTLYTVSSLMLIVWSAINAAFVPFLFENIDKPESRLKIQSLSSKLLAVFAAVAFVLTMMGPEIVKVLATEEYYEAVYIMPPIATGVFFISISNMYSNVLIYHKKTSFIMISSIVAAVLNVVLNYFGIRRFGYMAAAYTTLIAYIVLGIIQMVVSDYIHKKRVNDSKDTVYNTKLIVGISILTVIMCMGCLLLYRTTIVRYVILVIICVIAVLNRKRITGLFVR